MRREVGYRCHQQEVRKTTSAGNCCRPLRKQPKANSSIYSAVFRIRVVASGFYTLRPILSYSMTLILWKEFSQLIFTLRIFGCTFPLTRDVTSREYVLT